MSERDLETYDNEFYEYYLRAPRVELIALVDQFNLASAKQDYNKAKNEAAKHFYDGYIDDFEKAENLALTRIRLVSVENRIETRRAKPRYNQALYKVIEDLDRLTTYFKNSGHENAESTTFSWVYDMMNKSSAI